MGGILLRIMLIYGEYIHVVMMTVQTFMFKFALMIFKTKSETRT